ncbi:carbon-nitrogen hydrolase family protein [Bacillus salitolerans]|uniref:Carbon-nitrogen hydrolase family protein n=1 Tax=Bacillus salitolerans TaxID=1437434 RepID=A0ABW4LMB2_9BACI
MEITISLAQFKPTLSVEANLQKMLELVFSSKKENDIMVMPEGCLSGYSDRFDFLTQKVARDVEKAIVKLQAVSKKHQLHLIFGSCIFEDGDWYNAGLYISPSGNKQIYKKVNLAMHERDFFKAGKELSCFHLELGEKKVKVAIQLCREIRFPEQWKLLSLNGAELIFYLTNVIGHEKLAIWNAHLISRAAENQRFIISSNIAHEEQGCSSMVVSPSGKVIKQLNSIEETVERIHVDLMEVSNWYLSQSRTDLVSVEKMTSNPRRSI